MHAHTCSKKTPNIMSDQTHQSEIRKLVIHNKALMSNEGLPKEVKSSSVAFTMYR